MPSWHLIQKACATSADPPLTQRPQQHAVHKRNELLIILTQTQDKGLRFLFVLIAQMQQHANSTWNEPETTSQLWSLLSFILSLWQYAAPYELKRVAFAAKPHIMNFSVWLSQRSPI